MREKVGQRKQEKMTRMRWWGWGQERNGLRAAKWRACPMSCCVRRLMGVMGSLHVIQEVSRPTPNPHIHTLPIPPNTHTHTHTHTYTSQVPTHPTYIYTHTTHIYAHTPIHTPPHPQTTHSHTHPKPHVDTFLDKSWKVHRLRTYTFLHDLSHFMFGKLKSVKPNQCPKKNLFHADALSR